MNDSHALTVAILALNTLAEPHATSVEDYQVLDNETEDAIRALESLRSRMNEVPC